MKQCETQLSLFSAEASRNDRANPLVLPGSSKARKMTATSGRKWLELSKNSGPLGSLEKMLLESSKWFSPIYLLSWKPVAMPRGYFLYQLAVSEPDTDGIGLPLWATPTAMDHLSPRSPEALERLKNGARKGRTRPSNLREQVDPETVEMWHTPTANDAKNSTLPESQKDRHSVVGDILRTMFPTPRANDYKGARTPEGLIAAGRKPTNSLSDTIRWDQERKTMFPTPTTGAGMCGGSGNYDQLKKLEEQGVITEDERRSMAAGNGGQLNPYWVEWLMGLPIGWTKAA